MIVLKRSIIASLVALLIVGALAPVAQTFAQDGRVTVTVGVPVFTRDALEAPVKDFETQNPGIHIQLVTQEVLGAPSAANGLDNHLDTVQKLVSTADVVFVTSSAMSPEATRAAYYLNLKPLLDGDKQINTDDFYPQMLRAFAWDQGMWALPLAADATVLTYDPSAFDKAGLTYPTDKWTLDDLTNGVKALNVKDENGKVTTPGIELYVGNNDIPLYMSLLGKPLVDENAIPNPPLIDQPNVVALLDKLKDLQDLLPLQQPDFNTAPIRIESAANLAFVRPNETERKGVLLPGGHAYLEVTGVAVSGATQYPEQAYAVARFLTTRQEVNRFTSLPARQSLRAQNTGGNNGGPFGRTTPELTALLDSALANGYTATDRRYYDYVSAAAVKAHAQRLDGKTALEEAQNDAMKAQQAALDRKTTSSKVAVVATPVPTADPNKGITLKFGVTVFATSLPKKAEIEALASEFVKANPEVAKVDIQNGFQSPDQAASKYDCFYLPYSAVPSIQLDSVLSLDPFLTADKNYNAQDYVGGALAQVQRDSKIWALPMGISPTVMWFDPTVLANAGQPRPAYGWDVTAFKETLSALKPFVKDGKAPFFMSGPGGEGVSLLMLIAAYGGLPIDWSSIPPVVKFTDKTNVDAMRQVLDLAKAKLLDYKALGSNFGFGASTPDNNPLYSEQLNGLNFRQFNLFGGNNQDQDKSRFEAVPFPRGTQLQALSYSSASLYISAKAQNPDACYKWISLFAQHPDLMSLMPVRSSQLADPNLEVTAGKALAAVYRDIGKVLADPNTLKVPSLFDGGANISGFVVQFWLFQAWDNYVLNDKDLDTELRDAQTYADAYIQCAATVPPFDPSTQKQQDYIRSFTDCAVKADPRLKKLLGGR